MLMLWLALSQELAEIEVARAEQPKVKCLFKRDEDDGRYRLYEAWGAGKTPRLPMPAVRFGAMNREQACAWVLDVVRASFDGEWSDLRRPANGPDTVDKGTASRCRPAGASTSSSFTRVWLSTTPTSRATAPA